MPNIYLTDVCNLRCPYCFANEFVNHTANEISMDNFQRALDFILRDGTCHNVGLIGGEPTLHAHFQEILQRLIADPRVELATVYTNGVNLQAFYRELAHPKFRLLVNCNAPQDIGQAAFDKMRGNLDEMALHRYMGDRIVLGINLYRPDFDYGYFAALLERYGMKRARFSITVPNVETMRNRNAHAYFLAIKPQLKRFFRDLLRLGVTPFYDCNKLPSCLVSAGDRAEFQSFLPPEGSPPPGDSALASEAVRCAPVVDILQDLTAVRCFGLSGYTKVSIADFSGIQELKQYYIQQIDAFAYETAYAKRCLSCRKRQNMTCMGGCLAFKIEDILKVRAYAQSLMEEKES